MKCRWCGREMKDVSDTFSFILLYCEKHVPESLREWIDKYTSSEEK